MAPIKTSESFVQCATLVSNDIFKSPTKGRERKFDALPKHYIGNFRDVGLNWACFPQPPLCPPLSTKRLKCRSHLKRRFPSRRVIVVSRRVSSPFHYF